MAKFTIEELAAMANLDLYNPRAAASPDEEESAKENAPQSVHTKDDVISIPLSELHPFGKSKRERKLIMLKEHTISTEQQHTVKRLFVDMDGTLAEFIPTEKLEDLYERYYFLNLRPMSEVVSAVKSIVENRPDIEVFILSSVLGDSQYAKEEKNAWLNIWLPEIDDKHRLFPLCGESKIDSVPFIGNSEDYLLDDYTKNLLEWDSACGTGIKLLNGINHTRGTWLGLRVSSSRSAKSLYNDLVNIIDHEVSRGIDVQDQELEL